MTADISTVLAGTSLSSCILNASGALCRTSEELDSLMESVSGAVVTKSCTLLPREGNPEPRYFDWPEGSINSMGLPNLGVDFYLDFVARRANFGKPIFLSVSGLSLEENLELLRRVRVSTGFLAVELNLSCPNIPGKPQIAYDFERTRYVLKKISEFYDHPFGVKLPPYFDMAHFEQMAELLNRFPLRFVTCINSVGNGLYVNVDSERMVIKPNGGVGGLGGACVKPVALANVRIFSTHLREDIQVIGCGGVVSGQDVFEHLLCGASAVQVGTQLIKEGPAVFHRLNFELKRILQQKGYSSIEDFRGRIRVI
ncbi:MAG: dihydroorotate oxidase [Flavobacteriales bacterium Tduv]